MLDICKNKALTAYKQINKACIVEDTSLCFNAMKGMPGPYMFILLLNMTKYLIIPLKIENGFYKR